MKRSRAELSLKSFISSYGSSQLRMDSSLVISLWPVQWNGLMMWNCEIVYLKKIKNNLQKLKSISLTFFKSEKLKSIITLKKNQTIKLNLIAYRISFNRFRLHMKIPHFDGQIIPRDHIAPRIREFDVRYGWDYFGEETAIRWIFRLLEDYG